MKEYEYNTWPRKEHGLHYPVTDCPCRPTIQVRMGEEILVHRSILEKVPWIASEILMGIRCAEHHLLVDQRNLLNPKGHIHRKQLKPLYEYSHSIQ